jgi:hypothetical protein
MMPSLKTGWVFESAVSAQVFRNHGKNQFSILQVRTKRGRKKPHYGVESFQPHFRQARLVSW